MENLQSVFSLLVPVYAIILLGYWFKRIGLYNEAVDSFLNTTAFYYILPVVILKGLLFNRLFVCGNMLLMLVFLCSFFSFLYVVFRLAGMDMSFLIMSMRGNIVYFGIPVLGTVLLENDFLRGTLFISVLSPVTITLVGFLDSGQRGQWLSKILKNPFLITLLAGIILRKTGLSFEPLRFTMDRITQSLFFISLVIVGGNLSFKLFRRFSIPEILAVITKLLIMPGCFLAFARLAGLDPVCTKIGLILFSTPAAVTNYTLAVKLGLNAENTAKNVMLTTFLYFLYLPFLVAFIRTI